MEATAALERLGGNARRVEILTLVTRRTLEQAVERGEVTRFARGRYALPTDDPARRAAIELSAVSGLISAAAHWGWRRMWEPRRPQVLVPRGRKVAPSARSAYDVRWRTVPPEDVVDGWVTSRERTVIDCAVLLPFDQALSIADSALREGRITRDALLRRVRALDAQLRPRALRVVEAADPRSANPFESVLRSVALPVPALQLRPQLRIDDADGFVGRVDLADRRLKIVMEAESLEFHGELQMIDRDCRRYTRLAADGWLVLRFSWNQVMHQQAWVRTMIKRAVRERERLLALHAVAA